MMANSNATPALSIVIPAKNEEHYLAITLPEILRQAQELPYSFEIILVDNESIDGTRDVALPYDVRTIVVSGSIGMVRRVGVEEARGSTIVFIDADCLPAENWLYSGLKLLEQSPQSIFGCQIRRPEDSGYMVRYWALKQKEQDSIVRHLPGASLFFRKNIVEVIGNFDAELPSSEDLDFTLRATNAGFEVFKPKSVAVYHLGWPESVGGFIKRQRWHAKSYTQVNRGFRDPILLATIIFSLCHIFAVTMLILGQSVVGLLFFLAAVILALLHGLRRVLESDEPRSGSLLLGACFVSYLYFLGRGLGVAEGALTKRCKRCSVAN